MIGWIEQHSSFLQVLVGVATLLVWVFYAQLLLGGYLRTRRPKIVINQAMGRSTHSRCLVSNMSAESVHIDAILVWLRTDRGQRCCVVTDYEADEEGALPDSLQRGTAQGPLLPGHYLDLGSIGQLVRRTWATPLETENQDAEDEGSPDTHSLEVAVVGVYSSERGVIGASRTFEFDQQGNAQPMLVQTKQYRGPVDRRRMRKIAKHYR